MRKVLIACLFLGFSTYIFAQNKKKMDSLSLVYQNAKHDTIKILALNEIASEYQSSKSDTCIAIAEKVLQMSKKINFKRGIGIAWNNIGLGNMYKGNYQKAMEYTQKALNMFERIQEYKSIDQSLYNIGAIYYSQGNYPFALEYHQKALKIREEIGSKQDIATSLNNIGNIHYSQNNYPLASEYYLKSLKIREEINDKQGTMQSLGNIGLIHKNQNNYSLALEYLQKNLKMTEKFNDKRVRSNTLNNIADIYNKQGKWSEAIKNYEAVLKLYKELSNKRTATYTFNGLAEIYQKQGNYEKSIEYAQEGLQISQEIKALAEIKMLSETLYQTYKLQSNYSKALYYFELAKQTNDSLFNVEKTKSIANLESRFLLEQKDKEMALLAKDNELNKLDAEKKVLAYEAEVAAQKQIRNTFLVLSSALIFIVVLVVLSLRQKQMSNQLLASQKLEIEYKNKNLQDAYQEIKTANEELCQTQEQILAQRDLLEKKNNLLEQYTHKIGKSIKAAQMIQKAILPPKTKMKELFEEHFVLFMPKYVVSGDFWWANEIEGKKYLIVADCTGHGVSGAMLTMIGSALLDRIVSLMGIREPAEILTKLHEEVKAVLQQDQTKNNEGMDIAITYWHYENEECFLSFAAAKRPLIYTHKGKIEKIGGSRRNIGGDADSTKPFESRILTLPKSTCLYLCSDGYGDQNDVARMKFSEKRLMDLLQENQNLEMQIQKEILKTQLTTYMEGTEQRDDILVIGVRL